MPEADSVLRWVTLAFATVAQTPLSHISIHHIIREFISLSQQEGSKSMYFCAGIIAPKASDFVKLAASLTARSNNNVDALSPCVLAAAGVLRIDMGLLPEAEVLVDSILVLADSIIC